MASSTHEIVILGGNFGGINAVHHLLRQVIPSLQKLSPSTNFHVTLVTPNTHFYFKVAAPRALINNTLIPADKIFKSIPDILKQYGDSRCSFLRGKAVALNPSTRTITVEVVGAGNREVRYDSLFISTGTTSTSPLWGIHDDHEKTLKALNHLHTVLPKAKTVLIAGAGPVGVETVGEIAHAFPSTKITLVSASNVLPHNPYLSSKAKKCLQAAKIELVTNTRVQTTPSTGTGGTVTLSNGSSKTVDLFIDARGVEKVNSEFLPKSWLDKTQRIKTRDAYFRVKGDGTSDVSRIYAIGDIVSGSTNTAIELDAQLLSAASSFAVDVASSLPHENKHSGVLGFLGIGSNVPTQKEFKPMKDTLFVPVGPKSGVGAMMGWGAPTWLVVKGKAEKFLVDHVEPMVSGEKYKRV